VYDIEERALEKITPTWDKGTPSDLTDQIIRTHGERGDDWGEKLIGEKKKDLTRPDAK